MTSLIDEVRALIEPWLAAERLELDDLEIKGSGRGRAVRVVVDAEGGVDLDLLADISNGISRLLDAESSIEGAYQLEVTSPGLERALKTPRHFQKSVGREVSVKHRSGDTTSVVKGQLADAGEREFTLIEADGAETTLRYGDVVTARTVFRWEKAPKPGK